MIDNDTIARLRAQAETGGPRDVVVALRSATTLALLDRLALAEAVVEAARTFDYFADEVDQSEDLREKLHAKIAAYAEGTK